MNYNFSFSKEYPTQIIIASMITTVCFAAAIILIVLGLKSSKAKRKNQTKNADGANGSNKKERMKFLN